MIVSEMTNQIEQAVQYQIATLKEWVEPIVWTDRMLTTLVTGVKRGRWYSLMDKVYSEGNVNSAWEKVKRNGGSAGIDGVSLIRYQAELKHNNSRLAESLINGDYSPKPVKRVYIPKPGSKEKRPLGIPAIRDRIAQAALKNVIEPIFESDFSDNSYGFRPGLGCKDALRELEQAMDDGALHIYEADIKGYFDTIPHDKLMKLVERKISDGRVLKLIHGFLKQNIMEELKVWTPESGSPQGGVISPLLANIYLDPLDKLMENESFKMIRYADDFVIMCRTREEAERASTLVENWMTDAGLTLHPDKTGVVDMHDISSEFEFLGYRFWRTRTNGRLTRSPRNKSLKKLKDAIRLRTKRCNGYSMEVIIKSITPTLKGWFEYFKHSIKYTFTDIDGWIRRRLRGILRKRRKRRGISKGKADNKRWPNTYFEELGFFSLKVAHDSLRQSPRSKH